MPADARNHSVVDEVDRIGGARIFRLAVVVVVGNARLRIERHIFQHAAEAERVPDLRLVLLRQLDALGVASTFEVENAVSAPAMLVVANQIAATDQPKA